MFGLGSHPQIMNIQILQSPGKTKIQNTSSLKHSGQEILNLCDRPGQGMAWKVTAANTEG